MNHDAASNFDNAAAIMLRSGQGLPEEAQKLAQKQFPLRRSVGLNDGSINNPRSTATTKADTTATAVRPRLLLMCRSITLSLLLCTIWACVLGKMLCFAPGFVRAAARPCVDLASLLWPPTSPRACKAAKDQVLRPYLWTEVQAVALQAKLHLRKSHDSNRLK